jgi:hypothetical protein
MKVHKIGRERAVRQIVSGRGRVHRRLFRLRLDFMEVLAVQGADRVTTGQILPTPYRSTYIRSSAMPDATGALGRRARLEDKSSSVGSDRAIRCQGCLSPNSDDLQLR